MQPDEFEQYGRQMIVPEMGLAGQERLRNSAVLVVGAGGLGCPAVAYLAGAGIGKLGIVDPDTIESSNLHRQILHQKSGEGTSKCASAARFVHEQNPRVNVTAYETAFMPENAFSIAEHYDVILDCTDRPSTRYLVNDVAAILNKPLVSASALKTDGQLAVYHYRGGPCYRCLFPRPPPAGTVTACGDGGIIGPVVGTMGVLQALEAIKIIAMPDLELVPSLTLFSALSFPQWRCMRIRGRQKDCSVCGDSPLITRDQVESGALDYIAWCGVPSFTSVDPAFRKDPQDISDISEYNIVDVRPEVQFEFGSLANASNIPLEQVLKASALSELNLEKDSPILVVCRHGNDSQVALSKLLSLGVTAGYDLRGGLMRWSLERDPKIPRY